MKPHHKKLLLGGILIAAFIGLVLAGAADELTFDRVRANRDLLLTYRDAHLVRTVLVYFFAYVLYTALAIPGAGMVSVIGGLLFGWFWGTLVALLASTVGATIACLLARYLFRDWIQNRFRDHLAEVNRGFARDGGYYLLSLRLIPLFPFFMVNLTMGVLPIGLAPYFWVSLAGMLPGTFLHVVAGTQLARIHSLSDVFTLPVLLSFVALGFIPMLGQWIFSRFRRPGAGGA